MEDVVGLNMEEEKKLILVQKKFKADTTTILSARVSTELMKKIEILANKTNRNRNEIVQILLDYAVNNTLVQDSDEEEKEGK